VSSELDGLLSYLPWGFWCGWPSLLCQCVCYLARVTDGGGDVGRSPSVCLLSTCDGRRLSRLAVLGGTGSFLSLLACWRSCLSGSVCVLRHALRRSVRLLSSGVLRDGCTRPDKPGVSWPSRVVHS